MPLQVVARSLSTEERRALESFRAPKAGLFPWLVNLILLPATLGGLIGFLLKLLGIPERRGYALGLVVSTSVGVWRLISEWREDRALWTPYEAAHRAAATGGTVNTFTFSPLFAWEVGDVEDFGPAYVFEVGGDQLVYVCSQELPYPENGTVAVGAIRALVVPHVNSVLSLEWQEGRTSISPSTVPLAQVGVTLLDSFTVLSRSRTALPPPPSRNA
jgi:hypothetical protein